MVENESREKRKKRLLGFNLTGARVGRIPVPHLYAVAASAGVPHLYAVAASAGVPHLYAVAASADVPHLYAMVA